MKLSKANRIVRVALEKARELDLDPVAVAVVDPGGHLVSFQREDGAGILRFDIAYAKAWGSLGMGFGSRELAQRAQASPAFVTILASVSAGRVAPSPGGVIVLDRGGRVVGAVGVSGDAGDRDEACAIAGVEAADLVACAGKPPKEAR